jgi:CRISPR-associated protein Cmr4
MRYGKIEAAGQHKSLTKEQKQGCPIIYTFGTATDTSSSGTPSEGSTQAGTVSIGDARILFFPVRSMAGPLWVSTKEILEEAWGASSLTLPKKNEQERVEPDCEKIVTTMAQQDTPLNLGWLLFQATSGLVIEPPESVKQRPEWDAVKGHIALVNAKLFSQIVNSNLEVRTSVSIKPETGAAESGALFTYEAIPRTTWLWSDVIEDNYRKNRTPFPVTERPYGSKENDGKEFPNGEKWKRPLNVVSAGMRLIEYLGVGGMGTRGFGRMRCINFEEIPMEINQ